MVDANKIDPRLAAQFIARARRAAKEGYASGSTSEQIVAALLNGRTDWLPERYSRRPLDAIQRLADGGAEWFHTMMAVNQTFWRDVEGVYYEDELPS